eukprot:TRINITY_DN4363_c0_g2_i1.p1 TRINITY_DN4363_c0_g2~~TRINITY_DN4363_c0_g2_i1.p1  ORF type:complete len:577 (-),score=145.60 TRINITY_DN4363_c0_g2_i1:202-1932(-)
MSEPRVSASWTSVLKVCTVGAAGVLVVAWLSQRQRRRDAGETVRKAAPERRVPPSKEATRHSTSFGDEDQAADLEDIAEEGADADRLQRNIVQKRQPRRGQPRQGQAKAGGDTEEPSDSIDERLLPGRQKVFVKTFGCPHNQSDGEYMTGQLAEYGYTLVDNFEECDLMVVNSCTVKHPSEIRAINLVTKAQETGTPIVLAGCVPSSDKKLTENLKGVSMLDVSQVDRIVDVVEETIKGNTVKLLEKRKDLPTLALPKVRKDKMAEIITINAGCLGNCTYCKTKLSRGTVLSHPIDAIVERALAAAAEGICHIELASEDMGAYGIDIGVDIVQLMLRLSDALPEGVMLRTGMTNPPYILQHVDGIIETLKRPNVHSFMHIPVQSGSDKVLNDMRREYTVDDFTFLVDKLKEADPEIFMLTDIICGFPTESEEDWKQTIDLIKKYKFHGIHTSQFYARPGTPAMKLKPLKSHIGKERYREVADFQTSYDRNEFLLGREERVWFTGVDEEHGQTVGRTKAFAKVLVPRDDSLLGRSAVCVIEKTNRLHTEGRIVGEVSLGIRAPPAGGRSRKIMVPAA